ncbi:rod shape-determining protein RodA [Patescibacteria group bacterium]|nr:rod shape-determining protein RodA [Patescibacteria group bacterium]MBU1563474.1 rod shape-determining protein RodA [Patescibacteria group bacterium]MBU2067998.1 rod shape-determining protein RodA [Patescibacteria group bacterium]
MYAHLRKLDWPLIIIVLFLTGVGLLTIYGIGSPESVISLKKQSVFLGLGFLLMVALSFFDYRIFKNHSSILVILYLLSLTSLIFVLSSQEIRGASSWFHLGPVNFEPIEFVKIISILFLAKYFSLRHIELYRVRHLIVSGFYIILLIMAVIFQPDFGSALVLLSIWLWMIVVAGIKFRHLVVLFLILILLLVGCWFMFLKDYQKQRILTFLNPLEDPYGGGYHISQSLIAVGSGSWFGQGLGANSQAGLKFLPEQHTDFIFATLAEQRGLLGVFILLTLFVLLFWRMIKIILTSSNNFSRLFISGLIIMIFIQVLINVGMCMAILPITGLTLPFVSYGGSSLVSIFLALGILQSIKVRNS